METLTSSKTIRWIENLAQQEQSIDQGEATSFDIFQTKQDVLQVETQIFMGELYYQFEYLVRLFNSKKGYNENAEEIALKKNTDIAEEGFFIQRNDFRFSFQKAQSGAIHFRCEKQDGSQLGILFSGRVEAKFGVFNDIEWLYIGSRVTSEQISRHYLTEFIQMSRKS